MADLVIPDPRHLIAVGQSVRNDAHPPNSAVVGAIVPSPPSTFLPETSPLTP